MAGSIRPNQYMSEANYNFIGGLGSQGSQAKGLFNGSAVNEWNTANVMYWAGGNEYVEFEVFNNFHIWRAGTTGWNNLCNSLKIKKYNSQTLVYEDVTINYPQKLTAITEKQWEKTISNLPKGKYRVEYGTGGRIDSEWFLENAEVNKTLILHEDEYKKWNLKVSNSNGANLIPNMTSNTLPNGEAFGDSVLNTSLYQYYYAFNNNDAQSFVSNSTSFPHHIGYKFDVPTTIGGYTLRSRNFDANDLTAMVKNWTFEGSNNKTDWTILDTRQDEKWIEKGKNKTFVLPKPVTYMYYRINGTANNGFSQTLISIGRLELNEYIKGSSAGFSTVSSSLPTPNQFIEQGMDNLSLLLDRKIESLELGMMNVNSYYPNIVGKIFNKNLDLVKYLDIKKINTKNINSNASLFFSKNEKYQTVISNTRFTPLKMTANNAPSPLVASASTYRGTQYPYLAFNNVYTSGDNRGWMIDGTSGWIKIDFGIETNVCGFKVTAYRSVRGEYQNSYAPRTMILYGSNDNINFFEIERFSTSWSGFAYQERVFKCNYVKYRYYRLNCSSPNNSFYLAIGQLIFDMWDLKMEEYSNLNGALSTKSNDVLFMNIDRKNYIINNPSNNLIHHIQTTKKPLSISFN